MAIHPTREAVCNYFSDYGLVPVIDAPTRGSKCQDNVFVDTNADFKVHVESIYTFDHFGRVLEMDLLVKKLGCYYSFSRAQSSGVLLNRDRLVQLLSASSK